MQNGKQRKPGPVQEVEQAVRHEVVKPAVQKANGVWHVSWRLEQVKKI
jgi:hypothetical protein